MNSKRDEDPEERQSPIKRARMVPTLLWSSGVSAMVLVVLGVVTVLNVPSACNPDAAVESERARASAESQEVAGEAVKGSKGGAKEGEVAEAAPAPPPSGEEGEAKPKGKDEKKAKKPQPTREAKNSPEDKNVKNDDGAEKAEGQPKDPQDQPNRRKTAETQRPADDKKAAKKAAPSPAPSPKSRARNESRKNDGPARFRFAGRRTWEALVKRGAGLFGMVTFTGGNPVVYEMTCKLESSYCRPEQLRSSYVGRLRELGLTHRDGQAFRQALPSQELRQALLDQVRADHGRRSVGQVRVDLVVPPSLISDWNGRARGGETYVVEFDPGAPNHFVLNQL